MADIRHKEESINQESNGTIKLDLERSNSRSLMAQIFKA